MWSLLLVLILIAVVMASYRSLDVCRRCAHVCGISPATRHAQAYEVSEAAKDQLQRRLEELDRKYVSVGRRR